MIENEKQKCRAIIKLLTPYLAVFPNCKLDATGLVLYSKALLPLDLPVIEVAMTKLLQTCKFFPTPAEIFEAADSVKEYVSSTSGDRVPTPAEAWQEAMELVRKYSLYKEWEYSCDEVKKAIQQFGKYELTMLETKDVNIARSQFMRIYDRICQRNTSDEKIQRALGALGDNALNVLIDKIGEMPRMNDLS